MSDRKVTIDIETRKTGSGASDSKDELAALSAEAEKAKGKAAETSKSSAQLGQSMGRAAELTGSLTAAMAQGGPQAQQLGAGLRVLKALAEGSTAGFAGFATLLVGAAASAYATYRRKVEEARQKLQEFAEQIEENKRAQDAAGVDQLAGQYEVLRGSIDAAATAQDRLNQAQAAADSAEKAARMADITLREKQARAGLSSGDEVGAAEVSARFARERRDLESGYAIRTAERDAQAKARAAADAERKAAITADLDVPAARVEVEKLENKIRRINEALADLYGSGAPMRAQWDSIMGPGGVPVRSNRRMVVDADEQARRAAELQTQLKGDGTEKNRGYDALYKDAAAALAAAFDRLTREKIDAQARNIEASAASMTLATARAAPAIDTLDSADDLREVEKRKSDAAAELADRISREESALQRANETEWSRREVFAAQSAYRVALSSRRQPSPRAGLAARFGSDGRIRTSDDLAAEAEAAAASAERAVQAAAARLRAAKANFERLEAAVKTQRDGD